MGSVSFFPFHPIPRTSDTCKAISSHSRRQDARSVPLAGAPQPPAHSDSFPPKLRARLQQCRVEVFVSCFCWRKATAAWWKDHSKSPKCHSSKSYKSCKGMACRQGLTLVKARSWASQEPDCSRKARSECHKEELSLKEAIKEGHYLFSYPTAGGLLPCSLEFEEAKSYSAVFSNTKRHFVPPSMAVIRETRSFQAVPKGKSTPRRHIMLAYHDTGLLW